MVNDMYEISIKNTLIHQYHNKHKTHSTKTELPKATQVKRKLKSEKKKKK